jgi:hypothetical protein
MVAVAVVVAIVLYTTNLEVSQGHHLAKTADPLFLRHPRAAIHRQRVVDKKGIGLGEKSFLRAPYIIPWAQFCHGIVVNIQNRNFLGVN